LDVNVLKELQKYVGLVLKYSAAVRLQLDFAKLTRSNQLFSAPFTFGAMSSCRRTDEQDTHCGPLGRPHSNSQNS